MITFDKYFKTCGECLNLRCEFSQFDDNKINLQILLL